MQISIVREDKAMKKIQPDTYTAAVRKAYEILKKNNVEVTSKTLEAVIQAILYRQQLLAK